MKYYIGIDMGTSSLKLTLVDETGKIVNQAAEEYDYATPKPGWREISPAVWTGALCAAMPKLLEGLSAAEKKEVSGIGLTGQMHTTCFMDADGQSIRPAIMWNDTRAADILPSVKAQIRHNPASAHIAGIISSGSPALNLYWLAKKEPESFARLDKFLIGPDYLVHFLTDAISTDYCDASTSSLFDLNQGTWSSEMLDIIGLRPEQCPPINGSGVAVGTVKPELAAVWGFSNTVRVVAGTGDNAAAAVATGAYKGDFAVMSLGTSGVLVFSRDKLDLSKKGKNIAFSIDGTNKMFLVQGVLQSCGRTMNWWMNKILKTTDFNGEFANITQQDILGSQLLFYPHIMGDKTLYGDTSLRGGFLGLGEENTRKDMLVAIMEGMAFGTRQLIEEMAVPAGQLKPLRFIGGGAKNRLWLKIMASVLQVSVEQIPDAGGAGYGAAMLAMDHLPKNAASEEDSACIQPAEKLVEHYNKKYERYKKIHAAITEIFQ